MTLYVIQFDKTDSLFTSLRVNQAKTKALQKGFWGIDANEIQLHNGKITDFQRKRPRFEPRQILFSLVTLFK